MGRGRTGRWRVCALGFACLVVAAVAVPYLASCARRPPRYPVVQASGGEVLVDLRGIAPGSGRFFSYLSSSGRTVDHFVYRERAGEPRVVLDACRTCYRWKKGYLPDGDHLVCVKCDMRFALEELAHGTGSCVPIALPSVRRGDFLAIPASALEAGARYF